MAGEQNQLFSNLPLPYRALPTSRRIEDRRTGAISPSWADSRDQEIQAEKVLTPPPLDPMLGAAYMANPDLGPGSDVYQASFNRYFSPPPTFQMPNRPAQPQAASLPYIDPHQPIAPGPAGWNPHGDSPQGLPFTPQQMNSALQLWQTGQ